MKSMSTTLSPLRDLGPASPVFHFIEEKEIYYMSKSCRVHKELLVIQLLVASYSSFLLVSMLLRSALKCFTSIYFGKTIVRAAS